MLQLTVPGGADKVLLHSCCAPCSGAIIECMLANGITPVVFFSNSNICTSEEYGHRLAELRRFCDSLGVETYEDEYSHSSWLNVVSGLENLPERGPRCVKCFRFRLFRAAAWASAHGIRVVTSSLASSRWKNVDQVNAAGAWACDMINETFPDSEPLVWWVQNWRKGGLQPRRAEIIKEQGFYNQTFCGCEFSRRHSAPAKPEAEPLREPLTPAEEIPEQVGNDEKEGPRMTERGRE